MKKPSTKQRFIELRAVGNSYRKISEELDVSKQTLINWSRELSDELANYSAIEKDHLLQQYLLMKEGKIKRLGTTLTRLYEELESRELSNIPTDKLLDLILKVSSSLEKEASPIYFQTTEEDQSLSFVSTAHWTA